VQPHHLTGCTPMLLYAADSSCGTGTAVPQPRQLHSADLLLTPNSMQYNCTQRWIQLGYQSVSDALKDIIISSARKQQSM